MRGAVKFVSDVNAVRSRISQPREPSRLEGVDGPRPSPSPANAHGEQGFADEPDRCCRGVLRRGRAIESGMAGHGHDQELAGTRCARGRAAAWSGVCRIQVKTTTRGSFVLPKPVPESEQRHDEFFVLVRIPADRSARISTSCPRGSCTASRAGIATSSSGGTGEPPR